MAERPRLEAVVFDAGGTLIRLDFEWMSECLATLGCTSDAAALRRAEIVGRRAYDASRGRRPSPGEPPPPLGTAGDNRAYFRGTLTAAGAPEAIVDPALEKFERRHAEWGLWMRPMEGAREAIDGVAALGLRRAVVSNADGRAEQHLIDCGMREGLEFVIDSQVVGVEKPDPRILRIALDRLGVSPGRALFVGDIRVIDQGVAEAAGAHFVLVDPWGDYGAPGTPSIRGLADLPRHVSMRFEVQPNSRTQSDPDPSGPLAGPRRTE